MMRDEIFFPDTNIYNAEAGDDVIALVLFWSRFSHIAWQGVLKQGTGSRVQFK